MDKPVIIELIPAYIKGFWKIAYFWVKNLVNKIGRLFQGSLKKAILGGFSHGRLIWPLIYKHFMRACTQKGFATRVSRTACRQIGFQLSSRTGTSKYLLFLLRGVIIPA